MLESLLLFFPSLISRVVRSDKISTSDEQLLAVSLTDQSVLPVAVVCYGLPFIIALEEAKIESTAERNMKTRCRQVQQRRPANIQIWRSVTVFSPAVTLSQTKQQLLSLLKLYSGNLAALETQYQAVTDHPWTNKEDIQAEAFWVEGLNYRDSSGEQLSLNVTYLFCLCLQCH